ncbi:cyclic nucleotide binding protein, putative [Vibrio ichthyoenteri ATCC 700023]|uniref:Cyclic nucleotide binding protein, putative n=1 Tax=Vibrio ichthyoenteri ATCC 700023 TaxID=870968 RepID=F9S7D0_9VIBR|nr:Crp/Fnr family transcriptional regulator [Vibrio ichthyoenteri]EGU31544.1 cyclic nucleotide binding protein, putative [Vibrio ichthyoenteri ATCC 700023]
MDKMNLLQQGYEIVRRFIETEPFRTLSVGKGDYILKQHQVVNEIYWASPAHFAILHTAKNGKRLSLGDYSLEDNLFGEFEYFSGELSPFDMIATTKLELIAIPKQKFTQLLLNEGLVAFWLNHRISSIYQHTMNIALERSLYPLKFNIIKDMVTRHTLPEQSINHGYMYQEAERFGCTERAYSRIIRELIVEGLITKSDDKSTLIPVDINHLQRYIEKYQR